MLNIPCMSTGHLCFNFWELLVHFVTHLHTELFGIGVVCDLFVYSGYKSSLQCIGSLDTVTISCPLATYYLFNPMWPSGIFWFYFWSCCLWSFPEIPSFFYELLFTCFLLLVSELQVLKFLVHFELILQTETSVLLFHVGTTSQYSLLPRLWDANAC